MKVQKIFFFQGLYYFITALWPFLSIASFEKVTGPKKERWLVYTVAGLLICSSVLFLFTGMNERNPPIESFIIAFSNCLILFFIDIIFVSKKTIPKIYLLDAFAEFLILILYLLIIYR